MDSSLYIDDFSYKLLVYNLYTDCEELSEDEHTTLKKTKYNN